MSFAVVSAPARVIANAYLEDDTAEVLLSANVDGVHVAMIRTAEPGIISEAIRAAGGLIQTVHDRANAVRAYDVMKHSLEASE